MARTAEHDMIADFKRRRNAMDEEFGEWKPYFRELRDAIQPTRGRFDLGEKGSARQNQNKRIVDATARRGLRTLRAGLMSGMTSPSRPWFKLGINDDNLGDDPDVQSYLHTAQSRMYTVLRGSNIYRTLDACYGDLALYGTFAGLIVGDFENVIHSHAFPMGRYRLAEDEKGVVDALHWDLRMTAAQMASKFGEERCSDRVKMALKKGLIHEKFDVSAAVEVRRERDPKSLLPKDRPLGAYYWEPSERDKMLMIGGHGVNGILAPRWERIEGEVWSVSSPGMEALGDAVQLQGQHRDKAMAVKMSYDPPMIAGAGMREGAYRGLPGRVTTSTSSDLRNGGIRPTHEVRTDLSALTEDIRETQRRIDEAFYGDLFRMASQYGVDGVKNVTATAIAEMHEEKLIALGPVLESLDHGLLTPLIEAVFHYMQEADILPPAPEVLAGKPIKVEFISLLAQAQKAIGLASIERTIGFAGTMAQLDPTVLDGVDFDEALREFSEQVGPPPTILRNPKAVAELRQQRAQAQQQQQMVENAQPLAGAAKLLSEATERGAGVLEQQGPF